MTLGEKIVSLRKEKGLSQEALAQLVNVSRQTVYKWESNQVMPDIPNIIALSKAFQISTDDLLLDEDVKISSNVPTNWFESMIQFLKLHWCKIGYVMVVWGSYRFVKYLIVLGYAFSASKNIQDSIHGMGMVFDIQGNLVPKHIQMPQLLNAFIPLISYLFIIGLGFCLVWKDRHSVNH